MADFTTAERRRLAANGEAMPDGSYPIRNQTDLGNAHSDYIRTGRPPQVAAWIAKRAKQLGLPNPLDRPSPDETAQAAQIIKRRQEGGSK